MIHIRRAGPIDSSAMADLLNAIIARGGTTAITDPVTARDLQGWMQTNATRSAWHLAEDSGGTLLGFQFIGPHDNLPPEACDVATFVRVGQTGLGIGSRLFTATQSAARALGYAWINATIRADNSGGLAYYQSRGFENWTRDDNVALGNGLIVSKISKRYDLR
ncbi:GNAT family N-acetyltransferase [Rhodobacteraceae bacterium D3-12]|nr:GNAT family N-acetyltransferase [Rhodobacteraceae bacterium D3-12]